MKINLSITILILFVISCTSGSIPISIPNAKTERLQNGKSVDIIEEACGYQLLDFIPIFTNNTLEMALKSVQYKANGSYVEDINIEQKWYYGFIGTVFCSTVKAKVIQ